MRLQRLANKLTESNEGSCETVEDREEKCHLTGLMRELSIVFEPRGLLLSVNGSPQSLEIHLYEIIDSMRFIRRET